MLIGSSVGENVGCLYLSCYFFHIFLCSPGRVTLGNFTRSKHAGLQTSRVLSVLDIEDWFFQEVLPNYTFGRCPWWLLFTYIISTLPILRHFNSCSSYAGVKYYLIVFLFVNCHIFLASCGCTVNSTNHSPNDGHSAGFPFVCMLVLDIANSAAKRQPVQTFLCTGASLAGPFPKLPLMGQVSTFYCKKYWQKFFLRNIIMFSVLLIV